MVSSLSESLSPPTLEAEVRFPGATADHLITLAEQTDKPYENALRFTELYEADQQLAARPRVVRAAHAAGSFALQVAAWPTPFDTRRQKLKQAEKSLRDEASAKPVVYRAFTGDDELARRIGAYDPDALDALKTLSQAGHAMHWQIQTCPAETLDAVEAIADTQGGIDHWLAPLVMLGTEQGRPTISADDVAPIAAEYTARKTRLETRTPTGSLQRHVGEAVLASQERAVTDFDAALETITKYAADAISLESPDDLTEAEQLQFDKAAGAIAALSKTWAIHQLSEDYATSELENPKKFIRAALGMVAATMALKYYADAPPWTYELLGGFGDDLVATMPFFVHLHRQLRHRLVTKKEVTGQYGIAGASMALAGKAATQIDPLATTGTAAGYVESGAAFATEAVGLAIAVNLGTAALDAMKYSLDKDNKLYNHLPLPKETRQIIIEMSMEDARGVQKAKELIVQDAEVEGHDPAVLAAIVRKVARVQTAEELQALIKPIPFKRVRAFKDTIAANAFQRLMLASQAVAVGLDVALSPLVRHIPERLTPLGASEMVFLLGAARLRRLPFFVRRRFQKTSQAITKQGLLPIK